MGFNLATILTETALAGRMLPFTDYPREIRFVAEPPRNLRARS